MPTKVWRCPEDGCDTECNRADRFKQHHKECHNCCAGSTARECSHADAVMEALPPKYALGCGFCDAYFVESQRAFLQHVVKHYQRGKTVHHWTATQQVFALLQRPDVQPIWFRASAERHGLPVMDWPVLTWAAVDVRWYIGLLESKGSEEKFKLYLPQLLELGHLSPQGTMRPVDTTTETSAILEGNQDYEQQQAHGQYAHRDEVFYHNERSDQLWDPNVGFHHNSGGMQPAWAHPDMADQTYEQGRTDVGPTGSYDDGSVSHAGGMSQPYSEQSGRVNQQLIPTLSGFSGKSVSDAQWN